MTTDINKEIQILANKFQIGEFQDVLKKSSILLKKYPKNDFLWNLAGMCFQRKRDNLNAIKSFNKAINSNPKNKSAKNNLAISLKNNKEYLKAKEILVTLLKENPNYLNAIVNLANLKNDTYFFDDAIEYYNQALKIKEDLPEIYLNISNILQINNKMDQAKEKLFKALEFNKNFTIADQNLSMLLNYKNEENNEHLNSMLNKIKNDQLNDNQKLYLHFALGKAFEDRKDFDNSSNHFKIGNQIRSEKIQSRLDYYKKLSKDLKEYFLKIDFEKTRKFNDRKKIFILGLPRSGTTLLERIVSSHSKVTSVSEVGFVHDQITNNIIEEGSFSQNLADTFIKLDLDTSFNKHLDCFNIKGHTVIDKTLVNFWYIGFLKIFFPNSKIIHSYRNSKDNCLSIYKNLFPSNETWLYSQKEIGEYYLIYNDLMNFWNKLFKDQIYNSKYEDLINDTENQTRKIIKFCDLEWDDKCLNHHKQNSPIKTLSINQANQPIYKTSINSSKFYEKQLAEMYSILNKLP